MRDVGSLNLPVGTLENKKGRLKFQSAFFV
jgi:hypothetical protein